jgi:hypothetical protein
MHFLGFAPEKVHYSALFNSSTGPSTLSTTAQYFPPNPPILEVTKAHPRKSRFDCTEKKLSLPMGRDLLRPRGTEKGDPS